MTILLETTINPVLKNTHTITLDTAVSTLYGDCIIIVVSHPKKQPLTYNVANLEKALELYNIILKKLLNYTTSLTYNVANLEKALELLKD